MLLRLCTNNNNTLGRCVVFLHSGLCRVPGVVCVKVCRLCWGVCNTWRVLYSKKHTFWQKYYSNKKCINGKSVSVVITIGYVLRDCKLLELLWVVFIAWLI